MLAAGDDGLEKIAMELGFSSAFHFSDTFKRNYGVSPNEWRRRLRNRHVGK